jgi:hypothetical protein
LSCCIRLKTVPSNYTTDWIPTYRDSKGRFDGMGFMLNSGSGDTGDTLHAIFNSAGSLFHGWDLAGRGDMKGDPTLDSLTSKIKTEFDREKRLGYAHELQKYEAKGPVQLNL